jgi:hypothetical protein
VTELRLILLLIGIIVIGLVALSALDRARIRRQFQRVAGVIRARADTGAERFGLDINPPPPSGDKKRLRVAGPPPPPRPGAAAGGRTDPVLEELEGLEEVATMPLDLALPGRGARADPARAACPDERIDFILHLPAEGEPVARDEALGLFKQNEYRLDKPRRLYGCRHGTQFWSELQYDPPSTRYDDLALAIQLVGRRGALDESELNTFSQMGLVMADALGRRIRFSASFEEALARAQDLARFCEEYDVIAVLHVMAASSAVPFAGRAIEHAARQQGLTFGPMNIFHMKNDLSPGCRHLFSLANLYAPGEFDPAGWDHFATRGLVLFMNVPCVHRPAQAFERMVSVAQALAESLGGRLEDQDGRVLTGRGIALIRAQIEAIEDSMRDFGIAPGSPTALRLFGEEAATGETEAAGASKTVSQD